MLRYRPLPSLKSERGHTLANIVFDTYLKLLREQMKARDKRDMRDPQELGSKLLNRPKHISILEMADLLDREYAQRRRGE